MLRFLRNNKAQDVSDSTPLPVVVRNQTNTDAVRTSDIKAVPLLVSAISVDTNTNRDILNSTNPESPTIDRASEFSKLVWTGRKAGTASINYTILGRSTDLSGNPLGDNWFTIATGTITGGANSWFRIEITQGHFDQYRIQVSQSSDTQLFFSKVVGVR